jgi:hypothetical protein
MYRPSTYQVITYFTTHLPIFETYFPTYQPIFETYFPTYLPIYETYFPTELVTKVKPKINSVEVHPQLSSR